MKDYLHCQQGPSCVVLLRVGFVPTGNMQGDVFAEIGQEGVDGGRLPRVGAVRRSILLVIVRQSLVEEGAGDRDYPRYVVLSPVAGAYHEAAVRFLPERRS